MSAQELYDALVPVAQAGLATCALVCFVAGVQLVRLIGGR